MMVMYTSFISPAVRKNQRMRTLATLSKTEKGHGGAVSLLRIVRLAIAYSILIAFGAVSDVAAQNRESTHSFRFHDVTLSAALDSLLRWYSVPLMYLEKDVAEKNVTAECNSCTFEEALKQIIEGHGLTWKVIGEQVIVEKQAARLEIPTATLAGTVRDSLTGEWLVGVSVLLRATDADGSQTIHRWCSTNEFGFFSLRKIKPDGYTLVIRSVGYRTLNERIMVVPSSSSVRDIVLAEQNVTLPEITVEGRRSTLAASDGISRGVYIRATPSDANQYHLEGARIYNPNHYGGVLSTFNADALRDVQRLAGGVPPYYGGRIGGILDVTLREGTMEKLAGSAGIGSLGSHLMLEGPLAEQTTFLISGRRGYPDVLLPRNPAGKERSDLNSTEIMAKVSHHLGGNSRLFFSGYFGRDAFDNQTNEQTGRQLHNTLRWGNAAVNLRWISVVSPSLFVHASAVFTRYSFDVEQLLTRNALLERFPSSYRIEDIALRAHAEHFYDEFHTFRGGVDLVRHNMRGAISEFSTQLAPFTLNRVSSWELSIYLQDQWRLTPSVSAELGARATSFIGGQGTFSSVDPRFSLLVSLKNDLRLYTSLTSINQFVHPYRNSGIFLFYPTIFFYPSTDKIRPTTSLQVSFGIEKNFDESEYTIAGETYYRLTQKLHEFAFDTLTTKTFSDIALFGEGTTYGAELTLTKRAGDLSGSIRYSASWASNRFAELNGGEPFAPRFNRKHELYASLSYALDASWTVGAVCLLSSGESSSFDSYQSKALNSGAPNVQYERSIASDLNGGRFPGFQRLEFKLLHRFSWWSVPFQASLRLLNGYGLLDPFAFTPRDNPDNRLRWNATFDAPEILPLYPVVNVSVRF